MRKLNNLAVLTALSLSVAASAQEIRATVDGNLVDFEGMQPMMTNGRVMVPVRGVFEHMNGRVEWDAATRILTATRGDDTIRLPINSNYADVNGRSTRLDSPAVIHQGRTMVPLRFLSEALGSSVTWIARSRTVEIETSQKGTTPPDLADYVNMRSEIGTVMPFHLNQKLSSDGSDVGDKFTATLDTNGSSNYQGLPTGTLFEGHVDMARAKSGETPGVLGLTFDRIRLPDGQVYKVHGALIGLDDQSVEDVNGRLVAKPSAKKDNLKYVGYGAGAGALVAILTKGNVLTNTLIGSALGFLYGEIQKDPSKSRNVILESGSKSGLRLTQDLNFRVRDMQIILR